MIEHERGSSSKTFTASRKVFRVKDLDKFIEKARDLGAREDSIVSINVHMDDDKGYSVETVSLSVSIEGE